jgi:multidrug efflux pump subunit AcrA (membrane-fusion protein)
MRGGTHRRCVVLVLLALGAGRTVLSRMANAKVLDETSRRRRCSTSRRLRPPSGRGQTLALPGTLQGAQQAPIAARATGYLKRWTKDIGASVEKGELLAEIESPEIDQQLSQASRRAPADGRQPRPGEEHGRALGGLRKRDVVSQQELDEKRSAAAQADRQPRRRRRQRRAAAPDAGLHPRHARRSRGVITRRAVDTGDLIDSRRQDAVRADADGSAPDLRQRAAVVRAARQAGQKVGRHPGRAARQDLRRRGRAHGGSIDTATRTMQVEIASPTATARSCPAPTSRSRCRSRRAGAGRADQRAAVPREGTRVAVVDAASKVQLRSVTLGRNLGEAIEIVDGIGPRDRLVVNPSDSLADGDAGRGQRGRRRRRGAPAAGSRRAPGRREGPALTRRHRRAAPRRRAIAGAIAAARRLRRRPDYARPPVETPPAWKLEAPWREGTPDDAAPKGPWWQRFGDARLDALQAQALAQSPTLALANARLAQARAVVAATSAGQWPTVNLNARGLRQRISANRPLSNYASPNFSTVQNDGVVLLSVNYEFDLAGRVQRTVEGAQASAEQAAADFENTRLLLGTDLATAYFNLRAIDIELDVLARSIALQRRSLEFVRTRHDLGAASGLDVAQQQALLDTTLTQLDVVRRQRGPFEHAVATLTERRRPRSRSLPTSAS